MMAVAVRPACPKTTAMMIWAEAADDVHHVLQDRVARPKTERSSTDFENPKS